MYKLIPSSKPKQGKPIKVKLRGHHISVLAQEMFEKKPDEKMPDYTLHESDDYFDKTLKGFGLSVSKRERNERKSLPNISYGDIVTSMYDSTFKEKSDFIRHMIENDGNVEIEIVSGMDSICKECPRFHFSCLENAEEDQTALNKYGLEPGKVYTAREVYQKMFNFVIRTGRKSPRDNPFLTLN